MNVRDYQVGDFWVRYAVSEDIEDEVELGMEADGRDEVLNSAARKDLAKIMRTVVKHHPGYLARLLRDNDPENGLLVFHAYGDSREVERWEVVERGRREEVEGFVNQPYEGVGAWILWVSNQSGYELPEGRVPIMYATDWIHKEGGGINYESFRLRAPEDDEDGTTKFERVMGFVDGLDEFDSEQWKGEPQAVVLEGPHREIYDRIRASVRRKMGN